MNAFIAFVVIFYIFGLLVTVTYNATMWNDYKDWSWAEEEWSKQAARNVVLAPLWPRYAWPLIKKVPGAIKNFLVNAKMLFKDAM